MSYCLEGKEQETACHEVQRKIREENGGKLPDKYKHTTVESCMYCPSFMESD